ncbi:DUF779 domain-containing protein [Sphingobacteriaceae bacterium WQ 2009]|uniref:DUF779 domain-containing protein n=1 Tax=Rhinopithecimicrobium faecis TaxID=2820698 RepID=A0A8T4HBU8_9SPHI|nr:DUF779 domain-containing protein [Sphingobacteriaceae bacterium WQ 2009]
MIARLNATAEAIALIHELQQEFGELMFYQAGGCCEGSQPQCFKKGKYYLRKNDAMIGLIEGCEFWIDRDLFEYWQYSHFELDVIDGIGVGGFSLETSRMKTFKIKYRLFSEEDLQHLSPIIRK